MARGFNKYNAEDYAEMVRLAKLHGSMRKAAREFGTSPTTVFDACARVGFHIPSTKEKSLTIRSITVDGIKFSFVPRPHYYRRHVDGRDETLAQYMYRKMYGCEKPKGLVVMFKDGDYHNYDASNLYFITMSERTKMAMRDPERLEFNRQLLKEEKEKYFEEERRNPLLKNRRLHRSWSTRRAKDPDGEWTRKMVETKNRNAEERGYYFDEVTRQHMSEAHKGKTKSVLAVRRNEAEKAAIRAKLGIRG
jgi:hypothetical protein